MKEKNLEYGFLPGVRTFHTLMCISRVQEEPSVLKGASVLRNRVCETLS